ncbi:hypothetical protein [Amycolatopsis circi]|uniref:hypothetical protein n=1 Tax=Amycolatopsis circi TaxID=871959 RepID=UPI000E250AEF|nr:hypothetical protein [Amycolatopsis circi]
MTSQSTGDSQVADRLASVTRSALIPDSLVGSYFYSDAARKWRGCVVAEPAPGYYLVEKFGWVLANESVEQALVKIEDMLDWRFYDSADWFHNSLDDARSRWGYETPHADG